MLQTNGDICLLHSRFFQSGTRETTDQLLLMPIRAGAGRRLLFEIVVAFCPGVFGRLHGPLLLQRIGYYLLTLVTLIYVWRGQHGLVYNLFLSTE